MSSTDSVGGNSSGYSSDDYDGITDLGDDVTPKEVTIFLEKFH